MATNYITNFKQGKKVVFNEEPFIILSSEFVKPGKGQAFVRIKLKQLCNGKLIEKTCKTTTYLPTADIKNIIVFYLYSDKSHSYFMEKKTFEELAIEKSLLNNVKNWIITKVPYQALTWDEKLISVIPNKFVELYVKTTTPSTKKNSLSSSGNKLAKLSTGKTVKVPSFIQTGDKIKIDTRNSQYVCRIK